MERTERLLNLVALFLDAKEPLPFKKLRSHFPGDYDGPIESAERKFERDKAELQELGIPLTFIKIEDEDSTFGYVLDKRAYYLPEPHLTKEELAVLYAAGSAALASKAFPAENDLAHALRKIGFFSGPGPLPAPRVRLELGGVAETKELPRRLEQLWEAIRSRKFIEVTYFSPRKNETTQRRIDSYGLALRRGLWSLVGWCHLRKEIRTFHVHRMQELKVNEKLPRSADYDIPKDFELEHYVATWPWQHRFHPPVEVRLQLKGELLPLGKSLFGVEPAEGIVTVRATDLDGLLKYVCSLGAEVSVLGPDEAIARKRLLLTAVLDAHPDAPTEPAPAAAPEAPSA